VTPEQLHTIEQRINAWIRADGNVSWDVTDYKTAIERGAIALFGEKYGDKVRMVHITRNGTPAAEEAEVASRDSIELCGGTHVAHTGQIGFARIVNESSIGSGLRRIEMLTGRGAETWVDTQLATLQNLSARLGVPSAQVIDRLDALLAEQKDIQGELDTLRSRIIRGETEKLLDGVLDVAGVSLVVAQVENADSGRLREMGDWLRDKLGSGIVVLASVVNDKPQLLTMISQDLVQRGYHAGNMVRALAQIVGGGGGGRPDMAQAGGRDASKLALALDRVPELVTEQGSRVGA
jgi:alanyl-tRNA synthetase